MGGLRIETVKLDKKSVDPGSPEEGELWYNITAKRYKVFRDGLVRELLDRQEFLDHVNDTENPHDTSLEEARLSGNQLSGPVLLDGELTIQNGNQIVPDVTDTGSVGTDAKRFEVVAAQSLIIG